MAVHVLTNQKRRRKMKHLKSVLFLMVALMLVLSACGGGTVATQAPAQSGGGTSATEAPAVDKKVATFIFTQEFDDLNPLYTNQWFTGITYQMWSCYGWNYDDQNNPVPVLVKEMPTTENGGISADGKTLTFKLRDDLVWSDGEKITADDFVFTFDMYMSPKNAVSTQSPYDKMESVTAADPQTVVVVFKEVFAPWAATLWKGIIPKHVLQPIFDASGTLDGSEYSRNPMVGCGPYNFAEWEAGSFARFVANDKYWLGKPKIDEIFVRFVPDDASQIAALKSGEGDLGIFIAYSDIPALEEAGIQLVTAFSGYNEGIYVSQHENGHPALKDQGVRQAVAYALDRESLVQDLLLGRTGVAATYWDNTPFVDPTIKPYPYDSAKAKELLDAAGWKDSNGDGTRDKDGVELVLKYGTTTREIRKEIQAVFQQQLLEVGIGTELINVDNLFDGYADGGPAAKGEFDIFEYSTVAEYPDPHTSEWMCSNIPTDESPDGTNWQAVCDNDLEALFNQESAQVDAAARQATFHEISRMIFDKAYWIGFYWDPDIWAVSSRLVNVKLSGATAFYNIMEWDIK
jgi:peptide/nickel transport system substrate-binding protein